jgi:hypothetical protein
MPAPSNANSLSLGRPVVDASTIDTMEDVQTFAAKVQEYFVGAGYPCGAQQGDAVFGAVFFQPDGLGGHILYGGNPTDPLNPTVLVVSAAGAATVIWQDEGSTVATYGTVSFEGAGVTVTDGGTKAIVTIPGGSGTYTAGNGIDIDGSNVVSAELATNRGLEFDGSGLAVNIGNGLEMATNDIVVKPHTLIDVDANGVAVDFTEGSGYSGAADQYWRNNAGTFQWATLPSGAPVAGTYIDVSGQTVSVDLTEVADYSAGATQLLGHVTGTIAFDTIGDWLKTLPSYDAAKKLILTADAGTVEWNEVDDVLDWLAGRDDTKNQSIGADIGSAPEWQEDGTACP